MNVLASECSSGCESGWTLYLEQSYLSPNNPRRDTGFVNGKASFCDEYKDKRDKQTVEVEDDDEEEEEDLSMVSDASSGPPHFPEDEGYFNGDNGCFYPTSRPSTLAKNVGKRQKSKAHRYREDQEMSAFLDDTASSPVINFSRNNLTNNQASMVSVLDFSQGFSATHFEGTSAFQDHFGFLQSTYLQTNFRTTSGLKGRNLE